MFIKDIIQQLKEHWDNEHFGELAIVLALLTVTGLSALYVREIAFDWLQFNSHTPLWEEVLVWLLLVVPSYQLLLLMYGYLMGQSDFVVHLEKTNLRRIKKLLGKISSKF